MAVELCENICVGCNYNQGNLCRQFRYLLKADEKIEQIKLTVTKLLEDIPYRDLSKKEIVKVLEAMME